MRQNKFDIISWKKIDFHIHSPYSLKKTPTDKSTEYLKEIEKDKKWWFENEEEANKIFTEDFKKFIDESELEIVSISDHNYFSASLYKSLNKISNLKIFPAAELDIKESERTIHILIIFSDKNDNEKLSEIEDKINELYKTDNVYPKLSNVIEVFKSFKILLIPHTIEKDQKHGIYFWDEENNETVKNIKFWDFDAFDGGHKEWEHLKINLADDVKKLTEKFEDNPCNILQFSDLHNIRNFKNYGIKVERCGCTLIKSTGDFNAIPWCLLNGKTRICNTKDHDYKKNKFIKRVFLQIENKNKKEVFSDNIFFSERYTTFIGNISSGKSLILHSIFEHKKNKTKKWNNYKNFTVKKVKFYNYKDEMLNEDEIIESVYFSEQNKLIENIMSDNVESLKIKLSETEDSETYKNNLRKNKKELEDIFSLNEISEFKFKLEDLIKEIDKSKNDSYKYRDLNKIKDEFDNNIKTIKADLDSLEKISKVELYSWNEHEKEIINILIKKLKSLTDIKKIEIEICGRILLKNEISTKGQHLKDFKTYIFKRVKIFNKIQKILLNTDDWKSKKYNINGKTYTFWSLIPITLSRIVFIDFLENLFKEKFTNIENTMNKILKEKYKTNLNTLLPKSFEKKYKIIEKDDITKNEINLNNKSEGYQSTVFLEILLSKIIDNKNIIVIDQPEDNINNSDIYKKICSILINQFNKQIIFTTHNANMVVNGDSEIINKIECNDEKINIKKIYIEDPSKMKDICNILEGGKEAFRKRWRSYGKN